MKIEESYAMFKGNRQRMIQLLHLFDNPYEIVERIRSALGGSMKFGDCSLIQKLLEQHKPERCL